MEGRFVREATSYLPSSLLTLYLYLLHSVTTSSNRNVIYIKEIKDILLKITMSNIIVADICLLLSLSAAICINRSYLLQLVSLQKNYRTLLWAWYRFSGLLLHLNYRIYKAMLCGFCFIIFYKFKIMILHCSFFMHGDY